MNENGHDTPADIKDLGANLPGLNSESRTKRWLAVGYYMLIALVLVTGLTEGVRGAIGGVFTAVAMAIPVAVYARRQSLPLVGGATTGQKALGWFAVLLLMSGVSSIGTTINPPQDDTSALVSDAASSDRPDEDADPGDGSETNGDPVTEDGSGEPDDGPESAAPSDDTATDSVTAADPATDALSSPDPATDTPAPPTEPPATSTPRPTPTRDVAGAIRSYLAWAAGPISDAGEGLQIVSQQSTAAGENPFLIASDDWRLTTATGLAALNLAAGEIRDRENVPAEAQELHRLLVVVADDLEAIASSYAAGVDNMDVDQLGAAAGRMNDLVDHIGAANSEMDRLRDVHDL